MLKLDVDVIIPIYNNWEQSEDCIRSVLKHFDNQRVRIILIDDGSQPSVQKAIESLGNSHKHVQVIRHENSKGYTKSANAGLAISDSKVSVILNSDTRVSEGWLTKILATFNKSEKIGIVGPLSNSAGHQSIPRNSWNTAGESLSLQTPINKMPENFTMESINKHLEENTRKDILWTSLVHGFCFCIRRETLIDVGLFDEELFDRGYGEENDYCVRASNNGWGLAISADTYIWHHKSGSFEETERRKLMTVGIRILAIKHGVQRINTCTESAFQTGLHIEQTWIESLSS